MSSQCRSEISRNPPTQRYYPTVFDRAGVRPNWRNKLVGEGGEGAGGRTWWANSDERTSRQTNAIEASLTANVTPAALRLLGFICLPRVLEARLNGLVSGQPQSCLWI